MPIWSLTYERVEKLRKELADKEQEFKILYSTDFKDLCPSPRGPGRRKQGES